MWVVLNECPDSFNMIGPDCSSWGVTARGTSMRSLINVRGRMGLPWVADNYCLVSRILGCNSSRYDTYLDQSLKNDKKSEAGTSPAADAQSALYMGGGTTQWISVAST